MSKKELDEMQKELDDTTSILDKFESRISKEEDTGDLDELMKEWKKESKKKREDEVIPDYSEDEPVVPIYEDVDELESAPIPYYEDKKAVEEIEEEIFDKEEVQEEDIKEEIIEEEKKSVKITKGMKYKRNGKVLMLITSFLIPLSIVLIIVGSHSNLLVKKTIEQASYGVLAISIVLFLLGFILYFKYRKKDTIRRKPLVLKVLYSLTMACYLIGCFYFILLLYGPNKNFKDWLVTTAMNTMDHHYYCEWFYSEKDIEDTYSRNFFEEIEDETDLSLVQTNQTIVVDAYKDEYEREILEHDVGATYKLIKFSVNGCPAYLAVIYDPSKVRVTTTNKVGVRGQYVTSMAKREKAVVATNGAGFYDPGHNSEGGKPRGVTIVNSKIITNNEYKKVSVGGLIGFTKDNKLVLLRNKTAKEALDMGVRDAVSWGPFLIVNGKSAYTKGNGGWGYAARTAIGQRADGIVLMLVVDSNYNRTKGASMVDLTKIMERYGAINATNLDGGTSSVMVVEGEMINDPIDGALRHKTRPIATAFVVDK